MSAHGACNEVRWRPHPTNQPPPLLRCMRAAAWINTSSQAASEPPPPQQPQPRPRPRPPPQPQKPPQPLKPPSPPQPPGSRRSGWRRGAVTPSLHPKIPDTPGRGLGVRQSMGWTKVCSTDRSGIRVVKSDSRTRVLPANLERARVE